MQHELSAISIFVTVVEAGSFVKAAEQLHLTRSAISKKILLALKISLVWLYLKEQHVHSA